MRRRDFPVIMSGPTSAPAAPADPIGDALRADISMSLSYVGGQWTDPAGNRTWTSAGTTPIPSVETAYGSAVSLNGTDQYLSTSGDSPGLTPGDADFTIIAYAKINTLPANARFLVIKDNTNGDDEYYITVKGPIGDYKFYFLVDGADGGLDVYSDTFGGASAGGEYLIFAWYTASDNLAHIQVNNGAIDTSSWSLEVAPITPPTTIDIGADTLAGGFVPPPNYLDGNVIIHFLPRLLTTDEKDYLWNSGAGRSLY